MATHLLLTFLGLSVLYFNIIEIQILVKTIGVTVFLFHLAANLSTFIQQSSKQFVDPVNRLVLVTGCDSGFGLEVAKRLADFGFHVLAGVLSEKSDGCKELNTYGCKRLRTVKLDITKQEDIDHVVYLVAYLTNYERLIKDGTPRSIFGHADGRLELWALLNNAGLARFIPFEFGTIEDDLMPMFEVNVFGTVRLTKAFLPFLRRSQGRLVNIGSVSDRITIAGLTGYSMSKHVVKSMTDGLRQELSRFNVRSILVEPTLYKTPISNIDQLIKLFNQSFHRTDEMVKSDYGDQNYKILFENHLRKMIVLTRNNINEVVDSIEDSIINCNPKDKYFCASILQKACYWIINQLRIDFQDFLCTFTPPRGFVNFCHQLDSYF